MEWCVVKSGFEAFDALHSGGLGIMLATMTGGPIRMRDCGVCYRLESSVSTLPTTGPAVIGDILRLPAVEEVLAWRYPERSSVAIANFDGLQAALFTTPGLRVLSVYDLQQKARRNPQIGLVALKRVETVIERWIQWAGRRKYAGLEWEVWATSAYKPDKPEILIPKVAANSGMNVLMTLDPGFSYSARRALSDRRIGYKTGLTIANPPYAVIFAFIGAARFLRAQRVAGNLVLLQVPLFADLELHPDTMQALLKKDDRPPGEILIDHGLGLETAVAQKSLVYQVLQTQGAQQSISIDRGALDLQWFESLRIAAGSGVLRWWRRLLGQEPHTRLLEVDLLQNILLHHQGCAWISHLYNSAQTLMTYGESKVRPYSEKELKGITAMLRGSDVPALAHVLDRKEGTARFGRALYLLGRHNLALLRENTERLDTVQTRDQLLRALAIAIQDCALLQSRSQFLIVPSERDLHYLLQDVDRFGARSISTLLIILAAVRPYREPGNATKSDSTVGEDTQNGDGSSELESTPTDL